MPAAVAVVQLRPAVAVVQLRPAVAVVQLRPAAVALRPLMQAGVAVRQPTEVRAGCPPSSEAARAGRNDAKAGAPAAGGAGVALLLPRAGGGAAGGGGRGGAAAAGLEDAVAGAASVDPSLLSEQQPASVAQPVTQSSFRPRSPNPPCCRALLPRRRSWDETCAPAVARVDVQHLASQVQSVPVTHEARLGGVGIPPRIAVLLGTALGVG